MNRLVFAVWDGCRGLGKPALSSMLSTQLGARKPSHGGGRSCPQARPRHVRPSSPSLASARYLDTNRRA
jgi:hypothetical protein